MACASVSSMRAFRPPCQRTGAPVWDSQWPGRRNLPRRRTPRRAPVRADEPNYNDLTYVQVTCLACAQAHLVNRRPERYWAPRTKRRAGRYALTQRAPRSYGAVALSGSFLKAGPGGLFPEIAARRGPHQSRCELVRAFDVSSLSLPQRVFVGFVQALDFAAVEALIADFQPRVEGFGRL